MLPKPDTTSRLGLGRPVGFAPEAVLCLGDTDTDMRTARAAGMFAAGAQVLLARPLQALELLVDPPQSFLPDRTLRLGCLAHVPWRAEMALLCRVLPRGEPSGQEQGRREEALVFCRGARGLARPMAMTTGFHFFFGCSEGDHILP